MKPLRKRISPLMTSQNDEVEKQQEEDEAFAQLLSMDGRRIAT